MKFFVTILSSLKTVTVFCSTDYYNEKMTANKIFFKKNEFLFFPAKFEDIPRLTVQGIADLDQCGDLDCLGLAGL